MLGLAVLPCQSSCSKMKSVPSLLPLFCPCKDETVHQHPLALCETMEFDSEVQCRACRENCLDPCFVCERCNFFYTDHVLLSFHKKSIIPFIRYTLSSSRCSHRILITIPLCVLHATTRLTGLCWSIDVPSVALTFIPIVLSLSSHPSY